MNQVNLAEKFALAGDDGVKLGGGADERGEGEQAGQVRR
jgi:hypothetical protein